MRSRQKINLFIGDIVLQQSRGAMPLRGKIKYVLGVSGSVHVAIGSYKHRNKHTLGIFCFFPFSFPSIIFKTHSILVNSIMICNLCYSNYRAL